jgi:hypothetical protein
MRRPTMDRIEGKRSRLRTGIFVVLGLVFLAVTLFRVPLASVFSLGVLLICPLLMVGMHRGGHGDGHGADSRDDWRGGGTR